MELRNEASTREELYPQIESVYRKTSGDCFVLADLGCGSGLYHQRLSEKIEDMGNKEVEVIGFDYLETALENNEKNQSSLADLRNNQIPLAESSVDFVLSNQFVNDIITYWSPKEFESLQQDIQRVLKDYGDYTHAYCDKF